jgi:3-hydroxy-9,10-secoandrosta-1,3,5(10)-triene-9,17-dione monooxygenase
VFCVAVPREKLRILDDWGGDRTLGMRASAHSVEIKDASSPRRITRGATAGPVHRPEDMRDGTPGTQLHGNPMYLGRVAGPTTCR